MVAAFFRSRKTYKTIEILHRLCYDLYTTLISHFHKGYMYSFHHWEGCIAFCSGKNAFSPYRNPLMWWKVRNLCGNKWEFIVVKDSKVQSRVAYHFESRLSRLFFWWIIEWIGGNGMIIVNLFTFLFMKIYDLLTKTVTIFLNAISCQIME